MDQEHGMGDRNSAMSAPKFPTFEKMDWSLVSAIVSLVVVLLPGIIFRFTELTAKGAQGMTGQTLLASPVFNAWTILIAFILGVYALATGKPGSTRTLALLTLIVCIFRFLIPS